MDQISILNMVFNVLILFVYLCLLHLKLFLKHLILHLLLKKLRFENFIVLVGDVTLSEVMLKLFKLVVLRPLIGICLLLSQHIEPFFDTVLRISQRIRNKVLVVKESQSFYSVESSQVLALLHQLKGLICLVRSVFVVTPSPVNLDLFFGCVLPHERVVCERAEELWMLPRDWPRNIPPRHLVDFLLLNLVKYVFELPVILLEPLSYLLGAGHRFSLRIETLSISVPRVLFATRL